MRVQAHSGHVLGAVPSTLHVFTYLIHLQSSEAESIIIITSTSNGEEAETQRE